MIILFNFLLALFTTLLTVRTLAHTFHKRYSYDTRYPNRDRSGTITGWLRKYTGHDWHHIHFGIMFVIIVVFWVTRYGINNANIILLGIGLSMVADQITPLIDRKKCYFTKARLAESILFHIFIAIIAIMIFYI